jgi:hypothetical protein
MALFERISSHFVTNNRNEGAGVGWSCHAASVMTCAGVFRRLSHE